MPSLDDRVQALIGVELSAFAGGTLSGELPIPDEVANRAIAQQLARSSGPVSEARLSAHAGDIVDVELVLRRPRALPPIRITARVADQPRLPEHPVLTLHWTMPLVGPLAMFAGPVLAYLNALPPGVNVDRDVIRVDLAQLLRSRGFGDVVRYLTRAELHTREGALVVAFDARI